MFLMYHCLQFLAHVIAYISINIVAKNNIAIREVTINNFCETRPTTHALSTKTFAWQFDMFFGAWLDMIVL